MEIIICSKSVKENFLKSRKLEDKVYFSIDEFISNLYFSYDEKSCLYVSKKLNVDFKVAKEYLDNLLLIEDKKYNIKLLDDLVSIKKELDTNNYLIYNSFFKKYINNKKIIVYNLKLTKFQKYLLKDLNYEEVYDKKIYDFEKNIYEFNTKEEEIEYVAYKISDLIYNGEKIENIKLTNVSLQYLLDIKRIFSYYSLKINKDSSKLLKSTVVGKTFLDNLTDDIDLALLSIKNYQNTDSYNKIIDIINKYVLCEDKNILIKEEINNTFIKRKKYSNEIEVVDLLDYDFEDQKVFLINFNDGVIPRIYKDEDFIKDSIKPEYIDSTLDKNILEKEKTLNAINSIKNITITYKLHDNNESFYLSSLAKNIKSKIVKNDFNNLISYSDISSKIKLNKMLDEYTKYNKKDESIDLYLSTFDNIYNSYDHKYKMIDKEKINDYIKNKKRFVLSYTSIDNYNRCKFRFFLSKILNLKNYDEKFSMELGNIYHYVLEQYTKNNDIDYLVNEYISKNNLNLLNSNKFFIEKAKENLKYLINFLEEQKAFNNLTCIETEKNINIPIKDNISFTGFIDKIMYKDNIAAIIDYKTYVKKPTLKYLDEGIDLQLPFYMYLAKNVNPDFKFAGVYLQNILLDNKSKEEKDKSLKLIGYSSLEEELLKEFDLSYKDSKYIEGLKVNNDGSFSQSSLKRMLSEQNVDSIVNKIEKIINKTVDDVLASDFKINPKYDDVNIGCEFCPFKEICYMDSFDYEYIKRDGDEDAMD